MNLRPEAGADRTTAWRRLTWLGLAVTTVVLLPFALWGEALNGIAPGWMQAQDARPVVAALGIALLAADVLLPVPGSVVAIALCWSLGPLLGGLCVALGCMLAFCAGYGLGRLAPEARLRAWIGSALWDRTRDQAQRHALWWIVAARPLPLLSEVSALLAGVLRVPPRAAFPCASAASAAIGALYGFSVYIGHREPGIATMLIAMFTLPSSLWLADRLVLRRLLRRGAAAPARSSVTLHRPGSES